MPQSKIREESILLKIRWNKLVQGLRAIASLLTVGPAATEPLYKG
jgi:hypothetical protein